MKTCLCCRASCAPDAPSCLACGEASFSCSVEISMSRSSVLDVLARSETVVGDVARSVLANDENDPASETPDNSGIAIVQDPPTIVDSPKGGRRSRSR